MAKKDNGEHIGKKQSDGERVTPEKEDNVKEVSEGDKKINGSETPLKDNGDDWITDTSDLPISKVLDVINDLPLSLKEKLNQQGFKSVEGVLSYKLPKGEAFTSARKKAINQYFGSFEHYLKMFAIMEDPPLINVEGEELNWFHHILDKLPSGIDKRKEKITIIKNLIYAVSHKDRILREQYINDISKKADIARSTLKKYVVSENEVDDSYISDSKTFSDPSVLLLNDEERIHPAGDVLEKEGVVIEPIGKNRYLWTSDYGKKKGLCVAIPEYDDRLKRVVSHYLDIEGKRYVFSGEPFTGKLMFNVPSNESIKLFLEGGYKVEKSSNLMNRSIGYYKTLFDFERKNDFIIEALGMAQTWLRPVLNSVFHIGHDGTKGSGKTSVGEFTSILCRHGHTGGDLTPAVVGRIVERHQISLHIDEIDQLHKDKKEAIESILRKAQRRNNPYVRVNNDSGDIDSLDVFTFHLFSYRKDTEDALKDRSYIIRTKPSKDKRVSVLNNNKEMFGTPVFEQWFFWYMENIAEIKKNASSEGERKQQAEKILKEIDYKISANGFQEDEINLKREELWDCYTTGLNDKEKKLLENLNGRNSEIAFNVLNISKILGLDLFDEIRTAVLGKQKEDKNTDDAYQTELKEHLLHIYEENKDVFEEGKRKYVLEKGTHQGMFYFSRHSCYLSYLARLEHLRMERVSEGDFNGKLKELGFVYTQNLKPQKLEGKVTRCLIFDRDITKNLGIAKVDLSGRELIGNLRQDILKQIRKSEEGKSFPFAGVDHNSLVSNLAKGKITKDDIVKELKWLKDEKIISENKTGTVHEYFIKRMSCSEEVYETVKKADDKNKSIHRSEIHTAIKQNCRNENNFPIYNKDDVNTAIKKLLKDGDIMPSQDKDRFKVGKR